MSPMMHTTQPWVPLVSKQAPSVEVTTLEELQTAIVDAGPAGVRVDLAGQTLIGEGPLIVCHPTTLCNGTITSTAGVLVKAHADMQDVTFLECCTRRDYMDAGLALGCCLPVEKALPEPIARALQAKTEDFRISLTAEHMEQITCQMKNCKVKSSGTNGIWLTGCSTVLMDGCEVSWNQGHGIRAEFPRAQVELHTCKMHDNLLDQADISYGANLMAVDTDVYCSPSKDGSEPEVGRKPTAKHWVRAPRAATGRDGVLVRSGGLAKLLRCSLRDARACNVHVIRGTVWLGEGCAVSGAHGNNVLAEFEKSEIHAMDCAVYNTVMSNIVATGGASLSLIRVSVRDAMCNGVAVDSGRTFAGLAAGCPVTTAVLEDCVVCGNARNNVVATDKAHVTLLGGEVKDSLGYEGALGLGVYVQGAGARVSVRPAPSGDAGTSISGNGLNCDVHAGGRLSMSNARVLGATRSHGVSVQGHGSVASLAGCTLADSADHNATAMHGGTLRLRRCGLLRARGSGALAAFAGASLAADACTLASNAQHGVAVAHGATAELLACEITDSAGNHGATVVGSGAFVTMNKCTISGSGGASAAAEDGGQLELSACECGPSSLAGAPVLSADGAGSRIAYDERCRLRGVPKGAADRGSALPRVGGSYEVATVAETDGGHVASSSKRSRSLSGTMKTTAAAGQPTGHPSVDTVDENPPAPAAKDAEPAGGADAGDEKVGRHGIAGRLAAFLWRLTPV